MQLRKSAHTVYKTQYHVVLVTKYRRKILTKGVSQYLRVIFQEIGKFRPDVEFVEIGCDKDHVHLHMIIPPKYAVSEVVGASADGTCSVPGSMFESRASARGRRRTFS